jgi:malonyl-CoA/methylmalonyl-CoA synthetase
MIPAARTQPPLHSAPPDSAAAPPDSAAAPPDSAAVAAGDTATLAGSPAYYQLLGRTSVDIIKRGGYKISALHIESVLLEHPGLAEAAVLGLPDEVYGERIVAMVATKQGSSQQGQQQQGQQGQQQGGPSDEDLKAFCRERLPPYQVPQAFVRVQAIPRNAMGKVNKKQLAKELMGQS